MNFGSLFTGVGGFDLGFERAGMQCAWQVEQDKYCNEVLERHYPKVKRYTDVREVGKQNLEPVELICGGFPCQDLSVAGKRAGFDGERSSLWFEFERIIDEMQPKWVVIENVLGLLSSANGSDFGTILKSLDGFGYGVAWRVLDSQYFGVAQRRRRVFIVGSLGNASAGEVLFEQEGVSGNFEPSKEAGEGTATVFKIRSGKPGGGKGYLGNSKHTYTLNGLQDQSVMGFRMTAFGEYADDDLASAMKLRDYKDATDLVAYNIHQNDDKRPDRPNGGMYVKKADKALTQGSKSKTVMAVGHSGGETLKFNEKVNTLNAQTGSETTAMFNGVWQMNHADEVHRDCGEISPTLQSRMGTGGNNVPLIGVRRLTPTECCRLQGFPDDWNDNVSDTQRYKQMGNAVTVNVIEWIGKRIQFAN